jgi:hypothetical protein
MHNIYNKFKMTSFGILSGNHSTYALFRKYEKTAQSSISLRKRSQPLNIIIIKLVKKQCKNSVKVGLINNCILKTKNTLK